MKKILLFLILSAIILCNQSMVVSATSLPNFSDFIESEQAKEASDKIDKWLEEEDQKQKKNQSTTENIEVYIPEEDITESDSLKDDMKENKKITIKDIFILIFYIVIGYYAFKSAKEVPKETKNKKQKASWVPMFGKKQQTNMYENTIPNEELNDQCDIDDNNETDTRPIL